MLKYHMGQTFHRENGDTAEIIRIFEHEGKVWVQLCVVWAHNGATLHPEYPVDKIESEGKWIPNDEG